MSEWEGKQNKTKHGAAVLVLGDASFQSHPFYESIYGPSFCAGHILGFQAGSKSNWALTHHHKVKFALQYLKLTENIFDIKKQKDSTTRSFRFCLMCSTCHYYIFNHPLNGKGPGFREDRAAFKFMLHNLLTMWFLSLGFSIQWWKYLPWNVIMRINSNPQKALSLEPGTQQALRCVW